MSWSSFFLPDPDLSHSILNFCQHQVPIQYFCNVLIIIKKLLVSKSFLNVVYFIQKRKQTNRKYYITKPNWQHAMVVYWCPSSSGAPNPNLAQGPKMSRIGPAVTGCQQLQRERLCGALGQEKDAAHFTFSWLHFMWMCGNVMFSHHTLDTNR